MLRASTAKTPAMMAMWTWYGLLSHSGSVSRTAASTTAPTCFMETASADALGAGEQPGWPEEQDENDDDEPDRVPVAGGDIASAHLFRDAQDQPAQGGASKVAEAPEDDDGEGLQRGEVAHGGIDEEDRPKQGAGGGGQRGAEGEGKRVDAADVHAHERGRLPVLEGRPHGGAQACPVNEQVRADDERQHGAQHEEPDG